MARHARRPAATSVEAFRRTVAAFEGSVAIGAAAADDPEPGAASPCAAAARASTSAWPRTASSSPASRTASSRRPTRYLRMDGETPSPAAAAVRCSCSTAPRRRRSTAIDRLAYDGTRAAGRPRPTSSTAEVTTRDIDRGDSPHFLLKEITEAPDSFRKTLRGKIVERDGAAARRRRRARPAGRRSPTGWPTARSRRVARHRPGHRRRRRRSRWPTMLDELAGGALDVDADHGHRAVAASGCAST